MRQIKIFIELTRLNKPIGFMLLFWPCAWSLTYSYNQDNNTKLFIYFLILFFLGSVLMRSAGCIFNDIVDKEYDKKVDRTRSRPIPSGKISVKNSFLYVVLLCSLAFLILIQFNKLTIILGLGSMSLAFAYPFMKRITYWPQLFLGITFNWGIIMACSAFNDYVSYEFILMYVSAIFWTLGYDTIYGAQDMSDDEIIGIKSTSIKFKDDIKIFVFMSYLIFVSIIFYLLKDSFGLNIFSIIFCCFLLSLIYQVKKFNIKDPTSCLKMFKLNNITGFLLFLSISLENF